MGLRERLKVINDSFTPDSCYKNGGVEIGRCVIAVKLYVMECGVAAPCFWLKALAAYLSSYFIGYFLFSFGYFCPICL